LKIREEQVEGRRLRLQEKKAKLERLENPPSPVITKLEKKGKKKQGLIRIKHESEEIVELPYLPTPNEIILQREGTVLD